VPEQDVRLESGKVLVAGAAPMTLAELVRALTRSPSDDPSAGLSAHAYFKPPNYATSSGLHAAVVEVDTATGATTILDYVVVHEAGNIVNPVIADGQILGGAVQGIGGALLEHLKYDANGQPSTASYMDYLMPTVETVPEIRLGEVCYPTPTNRLGVKGLGEGGAVGPQAAIANAVEDALRPHDVVVRSTPVNPDHVRRLLRERAATATSGGE
jgi:aerobic carbon-monoxide dehydrogenase large subunit